MDVDRRTIIWPRLAWGMGAIMILGTPVVWLAEHDVREAIIGVAVGVMMIAGGSGLRKGSQEGAIVSGTVDLDGQPTPAWILRPATPVLRAELTFAMAAATMFLAVLLLARQVAWRALGAFGIIEFVVFGVSAWRNLNGAAPSLLLTPHGLLARRRGRSAFAPWPAVEEARSARLTPQRATTIRLRFSEPAVARAARRVRPLVPLVRNPRWHLYWHVVGMGVEGDRLVEAIMRCARDPFIRPEIGTAHGLVSAGLADEPDGDAQHEPA